MIGLEVVAPVVSGRPVAVGSLPERAALADGERQVYDGLGIRTVFEDPAEASELAAAGARAALEQAGLEPQDVDALVVVEPRAPERLMASEATRVQAAVGADRAVTFSVGGLGCVSISAALMTAEGLLRANPGWQHVLIAHGSKPPGPRRYRHPVTINGDGGLGAIVARDAGTLVLSHELRTDGAYWDLFGVEYRGTPQADWVEICRDPREYSFKLAIESRNRFREMVEGLGDVEHHVMQNLSEAAFAFYEELLGVTFARACRANLAAHGHLGSIDVLLNLHTGLQTGEIPRGDRVLVLNNSPVAAWSTMVVQA